MDYTHFYHNIIFLIDIVWTVGNLCTRILFPISAQVVNPLPTLTPTMSGTPTSIPITPSLDAYLNSISVIVAAIIGALITGTLAGIFVMYQMRKNRDLLYENQTMQIRLSTTQSNQRFQEEMEKIRFSDWVTASREVREKERQRKVAVREAARVSMLQANTSADRQKAYQRAIHADPNISQLQILDMTYPLEVTKVYVRLQLHPETHVSLDVDKRLLQAEAYRDPNALIQAVRSLRETRASMAMAPEETLRKYPRCLVLGDPGAGKSTLLKYLTLMSVDGKLPNLPTIPIHISLAEFVSSPSGGLVEFAATRWDEWYGFPEDEAHAYIETCLADGRAMLLLDALDETFIGGNEQSGQMSYHRALESIRQIISLYPTIPIIVTARKAGYYRRERLGSGFIEFEILDFRQEDIEKFVINWFAYHPIPRKYVTADGLNAQLQRNSRMMSLAANPLLLSLIIMVYELHQDLPEKQADLYKQCIDTLLFKWDASRDIRRLRIFKTEHKRELLTEIAWHFHQQGKRYFEEDELLIVISNFLPTILPEYSPEQARLILQEIEEENGLLKEQAQGWHGFLHLTLQEYFVAQYATTRNKFKELLKHCGDPWWEEVFILYAGSVSDASPLLRELLLRDRINQLLMTNDHVSLLWAGQCLASRPRVKQIALRKKIIDRLFKQLWKGYSSKLTEVEDTLVAIGGDLVRENLLAKLSYKKTAHNTRVASIGEIGKLRDSLALSTVIAVLNDTQEDVNVRSEAAQALGKYRDPAALSAVIAVLNDTQEDVNVRSRAARALGKHRDPAALSVLIAVLNDTQDKVFVRSRAAQALGEYRDPAAIPVLVAILNDNHNDAELRGCAAIALGEHKDPKALSILIALFKDTHNVAAIRENAAQALSKYEDPTVLAELVAVLKDIHDDADIRLFIAIMLSRTELYMIHTSDGPLFSIIGYKFIGFSPMIPSLILELVTILKDIHDNSVLRQGVADILKVSEEPTALAALMSVFKDTNDNVNVRLKIALLLSNLERKYIIIWYIVNIFLSALQSRLRGK